MNTVKNLVIALLAVAFLGIGWLCWQQHTEIEGLRAAALNRSERADLQKRVWDLEKQNRQLTTQAGPERPPAGAPGDAPPPERRPANRGQNPLQQLTNFRTILADPQVQALMTVQQKGAVDTRYAALFRNLNLTPEQSERLKTILADRTSTLQDVAMAAREQGIDPRRDAAEYEKLMANAKTEISNNIKAVIGESGFAQFQTYEETLPQRNVVNQLQLRLSYSDTPLSSAQAEQLVQVMAGNPPPPSTGTSTPGNPTAADLGTLGQLFSGGGSAGSGLLALADPTSRSANATAPITPGALTQSQTVLSGPQLAAFQQLQQQQQAQLKLAKIMTETMSAQAGQPPGGPPPAPKGKKQ